MSEVAGKKGKYAGMSWEVSFDGMPKHRLVPVLLDEDGNPPPIYSPAQHEVPGAWPGGHTVLLGQCEWCGKHATGHPESTPFLCEDCVTNPDRPPFILCSHCGKRLTEIIGVSRKWFRCAPCGRELGR